MLSTHVLSVHENKGEPVLTVENYSKQIKNKPVIKRHTSNFVVKNVKKSLQRVAILSNTKKKDMRQIFFCFVLAVSYFHCILEVISKLMF